MLVAKPGRLGDQQGYSGWTALSRPPWLTALAIWPQGVCFYGGGLFRTARTLWPYHSPSDDLPAGGIRRGGLHILPKREEIGWLYLARLQRDGWVLREGAHLGAGAGTQILERPHPDGGASLVVSVTPYDRDSYALEIPPGSVPVPLEGAVWADWDHRGRLVFARQGMLFAREDARAEQPAIQIADFRAAKPEPVEAPPEATAW